MLSESVALAGLQCVVLPQHGPSDEVTSEEEEEEEMGEVFVNLLQFTVVCILFFWGVF